jgi:hypothetical protein
VSNPYVILFTGGRELFKQAHRVGEELTKLVEERVEPGRLVLVRHGACPGRDSADEMAHQWISREGMLFEAYEDPMRADWDHCVPSCPLDPDHRRIKKSYDIFHPGKLGSYCPGAGPRRNAKMVEKGADICLAMPYGLSYGTKGCARLAKKAGIEVVWSPLDS